MIRKILCAILLLPAVSLMAQIPRWVIHPDYTSIKMLGNGNYVVLQNGKYGMLNAEEKVVVPLKYDNISAFSSNTALLYQGGKFVAFVNDRGKVTDVASKEYVPQEGCLFADGYLPVKNASGCFYINAETGEAIGPYSEEMPFYEGYAVAKEPKSLKHIFDGSSILKCLSAETGKPITISYDKSDYDDLDFISSASNGKSIVVIKKRVFEYDYRNGIITPLSTDGTENKKSRVFVTERPVVPIKTESGYVIQLKQGNMTFDSQMRLTGIQYHGQDLKTYEPPKEIKAEIKSSFKCISFADTKLLGLSYNGKDFLPGQFDEVGMLWGDDVLVKTNGKYGVISVDKKNSCKYMLNDNLDIGFEHKALKTNVKVVCPPYMKLPLMSLTSLDENCMINTDTRKETSNVESVVLSYECTLSIPDKIGLERTPCFSTIGLNYDGLKFVPQEISFNTWYINNYTVELPKHQMTNQVLDVDVLVKNNTSGLQAFFKDVAIEAEDSVTSTITKITEELYNARLFGWKSDKVNFNIDVTEDGCPTITYGFSLDVKPHNDKTKKGESIVVEKPVAQAKVKRAPKKNFNVPKKEEKKKFVL